MALQVRSIEARMRLQEAFRHEVHPIDWFQWVKIVGHAFEEFGVAAFILE